MKNIKERNRVSTNAMVFYSLFVYIRCMALSVNYGVVCEYNPFHYGHAHHLRLTKEKAQGIVCVMSGNFVQRGECAIAPKHVRAQIAVQNGADLVIELPSCYATASAAYFAAGAISLLHSTGIVGGVSFGSESGDAALLKKTAGLINSDEFSVLFKKYSALGYSFPRARHAALAEVCPESALTLKNPNDTLGVEYINAAQKLGASFDWHVVARKGVEHNSQTPSAEFASASMIRQRIRELGLDAVNEFVLNPELLEAQAQAGFFPAHLDNCKSAVVYKLRTATPEEFRRVEGCKEGLENRIIKMAQREIEPDKIADLVKTKRYTHSRIKRMMLNTFLNIPAEAVLTPPPYIRVLAFNSRGREMLREMKEKAGLPIIIRPANAKRLEGYARQLFMQEAFWTDLYSLCFPEEKVRIGGAEMKTAAIFV